MHCLYLHHLYMYHCENALIFIGPCMCFSTCPMRMRGPDGPPILCRLMTCVLRTPSCWRGSTGTPWSLTPRDRPQSSSWTSTRRRALKRPGQNLQSALNDGHCTCTLHYVLGCFGFILCDNIVMYLCMVKFDIRSKYKAFTGKHLRFMYSVVKMEQLANFCVKKKW